MIYFILIVGEEAFDIIDEANKLAGENPQLNTNYPLLFASHLYR
jgi:hypothetical protein